MDNNRRAARYILTWLLNGITEQSGGDICEFVEAAIETQDAENDCVNLAGSVEAAAPILVDDVTLEHLRELVRSLAVDIGFQAEQGITYPFELSDCTHEKFCRVCRRRHYASCEESKKLRAEHNMR